MQSIKCRRRGPVQLWDIFAQQQTDQDIVDQNKVNWHKTDQI